MRPGPLVKPFAERVWADRRHLPHAGDAKVNPIRIFGRQLPKGALESRSPLNIFELQEGEVLVQVQDRYLLVGATWRQRPTAAIALEKISMLSPRAPPQLYACGLALSVQGDPVG